MENLEKNEIILSVADRQTLVQYQIPEDAHVDFIVVDVNSYEVTAMPMSFNDVRVGVVLIASKSHLEIEEINKLRVYIKAVSMAVQNALIHERIQELAAVDSLTALFNRRFGESRMYEEYNRAVKNNSNMGIIIMDLDHFKAVNDTYGHIAGDRVLISVADCMKSAVRETDIVMRYGGEEFMVILPGADLKNTNIVAEKIRDSIENMAIMYKENIINVTASCGYGAVPDQQFNEIQVFIRHVDDALYKSKKSGINCSTAAVV